MEGRKWFILSQDVVRGPFDKATLENELPKYSSPLIWGRGQTEWLSPEGWTKMINDFGATLARSRQQLERQWVLRIRGQEFKPMNYGQMIDVLKDQSDFGDVLGWTEGYSEWKELYQIHKVLDDLGVSRRRHPRVPIMGQVEFEGNSRRFVGRALSISEGGLGVADTPPVAIGDRFKIILKSPNLFNSLHANAEVVFAGADGYCGMKFSGLPMESISAIVEYVKRFSEGQPRADTATNYPT